MSLLLLLVVCVLATLGLLLAGLALDLAAADLSRQVAHATGQAVADEPSAVGAWLRERLAPDLANAPVDALRDRAGWLRQWADRLRELVGPTALAGILLALLSPERPSQAPRQPTAGANPAASTNSSGAV